MSDQTQDRAALVALQEIKRIADGGIEWVLQPHDQVRGRIYDLARKAIAALAALPSGGAEGEFRQEFDSAAHPFVAGEPEPSEALTAFPGVPTRVVNSAAKHALDLLMDLPEHATDETLLELQKRFVDAIMDAQPTPQPSAPAAVPTHEQAAQQGPPLRSMEETREWNATWKAGYDAAHRDRDWRTFQEVRDENAALRRQAEVAHLQSQLAPAAVLPEPDVDPLVGELIALANDLEPYWSQRVMRAALMIADLKAVLPEPK